MVQSHLKALFQGILLVSLVFAGLDLYAEDARRKGYKIARHCQDEGRGYRGEFSRATMILELGRGKRVERKLEVKRRERRNGDQSLLEFIKPRDVRGTKLLTWGNSDEPDDQWVYLPAYRKTKRISSKLKTGSFMGSEFSYEDLGGRDIEKFRHRFIKDAKLGSRQVWVLEQRPKDKYSGYSKQIVWMDKKFKAALKVEYYDRKGELLKVAKFRKYRRIKDWYRPSRTEMENVQTRKRSILVWNDVKLRQKFSEREFRKEYLKK